MTVNILDYLKDCFPDTIGVRSFTSSTYKGAPTYGASTPRKCFVVGQIKLVKDSNGKDVVSTVHAVFDGYYSLKTLDEYTLPSRFVPNVLQALAVQEATDDNGQHHQTVFF